jgi:cytochrome P450
VSAIQGRMPAVPVSEVPGPRGWTLLRALWAIGGDPRERLGRHARRWGDVAGFRVGNSRFVQLAHPDGVEALLVTNRDRIRKDAITRALDDVLGEGLLTSEGTHWRTQRKRIAPSFQPRQLAGYADDMVRSTRDRLPAPGVHDIHAVMAATTLDIVVRCLFGAEPGGEADAVGPIVGSLMAAFETENRTLWRIVPDRVPGRHRTEVRTRSAELDRLMHALVARARGEGDAGRSLLARLLAARDDAGSAMSDRELRDELVTLFLAGHETTSIALALCLWLLGEHPERARARVAELDAGVGDRDPTLQDVPALRYTEAVLKETMRLYPPVWAIGREALEDLEIGGYRISAGTQIVASQWVIHRDPRLWIGADRFRPQRWLDGETDALPRMAYFPFGGGPRVCVGNHFAMLEATLVLATFLRHRQVRSVMGPPPELFPAVTLRPRSGVSVHVELR